MVYEIDFKCNGFEYEYEIDAVSGAIVKQDKDIDCLLYTSDAADE